MGQGKEGYIMGSDRILPDTVQVEWLGEAEEMTEVSEVERAGSASGFGTAEFAQIREGGRTYLTCACETICDDEEAMLADNRPEGLLPVMKKHVNGRLQLFYDITGKQSLTGCYGKRAITYKELGTLLLSVQSCLNRTEEYLLSEDCLVFEASYVYTNMAGGQFFFAYCPAYRGTFAEHIRELAHFLMEHVDYQDERAVALAGQFYQYADAENFSMTVFLEENRAYFEEADTAKERDDQEGEGQAVLEWERQVQEEGTELQETGGRQEKGKRSGLIGLAAIAAAGLAVWSSPQNAQILIPAGICAGIAAVILSRYFKWAGRTLAKKEREIYLISQGED